MSKSLGQVAYEAWAWPENAPWDHLALYVQADWQVAAEAVVTEQRQQLEALVKKWRTEQPKVLWVVATRERARLANDLECVLKGGKDE